MAYDLSSAQRKYLKGLAHSRDPVVQIGAGGISDPVVDAADQALETHELIKVKLARGEREQREKAAALIAQRTESHLCQIIGRVVILYRPRVRSIPGRDRIELP